MTLSQVRTFFSPNTVGQHRYKTVNFIYNYKYTCFSNRIQKNCRMCSEKVHKLSFLALTFWEHFVTRGNWLFESIITLERKYFIFYLAVLFKWCGSVPFPIDIYSAKLTIQNFLGNKFWCIFLWLRLSGFSTFGNKGLKIRGMYFFKIWS
jgi:hypothetical protein